MSWTRPIFPQSISQKQISFPIPFKCTHSYHVGHHLHTCTHVEHHIEQRAGDAAQGGYTTKPSASGVTSVCMLITHTCVGGVARVTLRDSFMRVCCLLALHILFRMLSSPSWFPQNLDNRHPTCATFDSTTEDKRAWLDDQWLWQKFHVGWEHNLIKLYWWCVDSDR